MKEYSGIDYQYYRAFKEFPPDDYTDGTKRILIDAYYDAHSEIDNTLSKERGYQVITSWEN